jgi:extradiol dioxygenase family protein
MMIRAFSTKILTPFHLAFPVRDLDSTRRFYLDVLGCPQGREKKGEWIDFSLFGHQIVAHKVALDQNKSISHVDGYIA